MPTFFNRTQGFEPGSPAKALPRIAFRVLVGEVNCIVECPVCGKKAETLFEAFVVETTCPHCRYCYCPILYFDPTHFIDQPEGFREELKSYIAYSNQRFAHSDFKTGIASGKLVVLFPMVDAWRILRGWRKTVWNLSVLLYMGGPVLASITACIVTRNLWYLSATVLIWFFHKVVSEFLRRLGQQILVAVFFSVPFLALWYFKGLTHWSTFSWFCVLWFFVGFFFADALQNRLAKSLLMKNEELFKRAGSASVIYMTDPPLSFAMRTRRWGRKPLPF